MGLELLLQYTNRGALAPLSPPVPPLSPPPRPQTYSDDGVQLRSSDLLSPLDGSQDLLLVLESRGWGVERCQVIHPILLGFVARSPEEAPLPSALLEPSLSMISHRSPREAPLSPVDSPSLSLFIWKMGYIETHKGPGTRILGNRGL